MQNAKCKMQNKKNTCNRYLFYFSLLLAATLLAIPGVALSATMPLPSLQIGLGQADNPEQVSVLLQIVALLTILSLAPAILILMTSFTRLAVVFSLMKQAIGTHQVPSSQIIVGLALFLTFFIMMPVWQQVNNNALQPYLNEEISGAEALEAAMRPVRQFMFRQTREKDLALFVKTAKLGKPNAPKDVPTSVLIPAFVVSELKTAFIIGFVVYVPFLVIDMVVASVLLSMGMMMLPPVMISMPFKLMLFVLVDGWYLIVGSLVKSFMMG